MSVSTEDFLKSIYQLKHDHGKKVSPSNMAISLGISNAAVTDMAKKLSAKGLVVYQRYKEIALTRKGRLTALHVVRRHRLWETFLYRVLNVPAYDVHQEAEILEHQTSDFLLQKIDEYLGYPDFDPHGDPIPDAEGNFPETGTIPLTEGIKGGRYIISRIQISDMNYLHYFQKNNISIGSEIVVHDVFEKDRSVAVEVDNKHIVFNQGIACNIHIKNK